MSDHHTGPGRILSVDSMRGFAMVLVMLQHAYQVVDPGRISPLTDLAIYLPTRMASVAFMSVSGMMISYFLFSSANWDAVYRRFARRALFLMIFAHTAIHLTRYFYLTPVGPATIWNHILFDYPITDTIALCLLIAPLIIRRTTPTVRAAIAAALLIVPLAVIIFWRPTDTVPLVLKAALFGNPPELSPINVGWPLLPWLGIFLCGSIAGQALARTRKGDLPVELLVASMRRIGLYLFIVGMILTAAYKIYKPWIDPADHFLFDALYPSRTTSLLPVYLGSLLWIFAFFVQRIDLDHRYDRLAWALSVFGRTSLFTYVVQFLFVHSLPGLIGWQWTIGPGGFIALFLFALPMTWLCSYTYGRMRGWISPSDFCRLQTTVRSRAKA